MNHSGGGQADAEDDREDSVASVSPGARVVVEDDAAVLMAFTASRLASQPKKYPVGTSRATKAPAVTRKIAITASPLLIDELLHSAG